MSVGFCGIFFSAWTEMIQIVVNYMNGFPVIKPFCISGINSTWSWCNFKNVSLCMWFTNALKSMFIREMGLYFSFLVLFYCEFICLLKWVDNFLHFSVMWDTSSSSPFGRTHCKAVWPSVFSSGLDTWLLFQYILWLFFYSGSTPYGNFNNIYFPPTHPFLLFLKHSLICFYCLKYLQLYFFPGS